MLSLGLARPKTTRDQHPEKPKRNRAGEANSGSNDLRHGVFSRGLLKRYPSEIQPI